MRIRELRRKEVINITDGGRLGFVIAHIVYAALYACHKHI